MKKKETIVPLTELSHAPLTFKKMIWDKIDFDESNSLRTAKSNFHQTDKYYLSNFHRPISKMPI